MQLYQRLAFFISPSRIVRAFCRFIMQYCKYNLSGDYYFSLLRERLYQCTHIATALRCFGVSDIYNRRKSIEQELWEKCVHFMGTSAGLAIGFRACEAAVENWAGILHRRGGRMRNGKRCVRGRRGAGDHRLHDGKRQPALSRDGKMASIFITEARGKVCVWLPSQMQKAWIVLKDRNLS
jgi:hypothetical protein